MADDVGSLLLRAGLIQSDRLEAARQLAESLGGTVPEQLVRTGDLDDETLTSFYRKRLLIPRVNPSELAKLSPGLLEKVPADMAIEFRAIPVALDSDGNLTLVMSDPSDTKAIEEIGFFTGSYVMRAIATQAQIAWCTAHYYKHKTQLYLELVAQGRWPDTSEAEEESLDDERETAPMPVLHEKQKQSRASTSKSDSAAVDKEKAGSKGSSEKIETGPLRKRRRPTNQQPSPPELFARAGEISVAPHPTRRVDDPPAVVVAFDDEEEPVVKRAQRGTDTAPILLSDVKESLKQRERVSGPIILERRRTRGTSRRTHLGIGSVGSEEASDVEQAVPADGDTGKVVAADFEEGEITEPGPIQRRRQSEAFGVEDTDPSQAPEPSSDEPSSDEPSADAEDTEVSAQSQEIGLEARLPGDADPALEGPEAPDDEPPAARQESRSVDLVGDDSWGRPGTTIPPAFLGAAAATYDDLTSEGVPQVIEEDVTSEIVTKDSIPLAVDAASEETVRSEAPASVAQAKLADVATGLLTALRQIDRAENKDQVVEPLLHFLDLAFQRTGFLALRQDDLVSWRLHGCADDVKVKICIVEDSTFRDVVRMRLPFNGPIEDQITKELAQTLDAPDLENLLILPIIIRDRVIGVLFGLGSFGKIHEEHVTVLSQAAGEAFERILLSRK